jgi:hypothetical protein
MPFTNAPWTQPSTQLDADDYCATCLIDLNPGGEEKVKANCKLPIRSTPRGPYNLKAMAAAAAALAGARGGVDAPAAEKRKAARKLVRLYREADREPPETLVRIAQG